MSNEAQHLLNHIQYKTGKSLSVIAKEIGYSRPHLNKAKTEGIEGGKIIGILKTKYAKELQDVPRFEGQSQSEKRTDQPNMLEVLMQKLIVLSDTTNRLLERQEKGLLEKVDRIDANLDAVTALTEKIDYEVESGRLTVLRALSRLENKAPNQLVDEADSVKNGLIAANDAHYKKYSNSTQNTGTGQQQK